MKRILSFTLAFLLLSALLLTAASCAEKTETSKETPTATGEQTLSGETATEAPTEPTAPSLPDVSEIRGEVEKPVINERFDGETIRFFVSGGEGSLNARSICIGENDDPNDPVNVAVKKRNEKVEEELGVKIELTETKNMVESLGYLAPVLASKTYVYDVLALYQYYDLGLAYGDTTGCFYNYYRMPDDSYIDLDAKYWQRACVDAIQMQNVAYFLTGDLNLNTLSAMEVSFVNAAMWEKYQDRIAALENNPEGYTSVYDLVNNGYWTMDLWCELSQMPYKDLNENGAADYGDELGLIVYEEGLECLMTDMFAAGAGVVYSTVTERNVEVIVNDKHNDYKPTEISYYGKAPEIAINTDHNKEIYAKLYTLLCQSNAANVPWMTKDNGEDLYIMEAFAEGNILLTVDALSSAEQYLSGMKDGYYIMPLPLYDRDQFDASLPSLGYLTQCEDTLSHYAICAAVDPHKIPAITATMELMGWYALTMTTPAYLDKALKGGYTERTENAVILDRIRAGMYFDFADLWGSSLDNPKWFARENYTQFGDKLGRILKQQQDKKTMKLKYFLGRFWECFDA